MCGTKSYISTDNASTRYRPCMDDQRGFNLNLTEWNAASKSVYSRLLGNLPAFCFDRTEERWNANYRTIVNARSNT